MLLQQKDWELVGLVAYWVSSHLNAKFNVINFPLFLKQSLLASIFYKEESCVVVCLYLAGKIS